MKKLTTKQRLWQRRIEDWSTSGLSQADYCRRHNIKPQQFYSWRNQLKKKLGQEKPITEEPMFLPIQVSSSSLATADTLDIKINGAIICLTPDTDAALFKKAVSLLGGEP